MPTPYDQAARAAADLTTKRCPFCAEEIQAAAVVCKHCHRDLPAAGGAAPATAKAPRRGAGKWVLLGILALGGWFVYYVATSSASVSLPDAERVVDSLRSDKVLTDLDCDLHRATMSDAAWQQLSSRLQRNVMLALSRVCMRSGNRLDFTLHSARSGRPMAEFDGRNLVGR